MEVFGVEPEIATGFTLNFDAEVREGSPLMLRVTGELKPPAGVTVTVYTPVPPRVTVSGLGAIEIENDPAAFTTSVAPVVCVSVPLTPWMVNG